jgi:hypothetical protein
MRRFQYMRNGRDAPVLPLTILSPSANQKFEIEFRVDTGADMTVVPRSVLFHLNISTRGEVLIADYDSRTVHCPYHVVSLLLGERLFKDVEVIAADSDTAYLGLDILNQVKLTHDGPRRTLTLH